MVFIYFFAARLPSHTLVEQGLTRCAPLALNPTPSQSEQPPKQEMVSTHKYKSSLLGSPSKNEPFRKREPKPGLDWYDVLNQTHHKFLRRGPNTHS